MSASVAIQLLGSLLVYMTPDSTRGCVDARGLYSNICVLRPCCSQGHTALGCLCFDRCHGDIQTQGAAKSLSMLMVLLRLGSVMMSMTCVAIGGHRNHVN